MDKEAEIVKMGYTLAAKLIQTHNKDDLVMARRMLEETLKFEHLFLDVENQHVYNFNNPVDFILYVYQNNDKGNNITWLNVPFYSIYMALVYIDIEERKFDDALKNIENALSWSPGNLEAYYQINEVYKLTGQFDKIFENTQELYKHTYDACNLARYYRTLGYYYIEKKQYDLAYALYCISLFFDKNENAFMELAYICNAQGKKLYTLPPIESVKILEENGIRFGILKENEEKLVSIINDTSVHMDDEIRKMLMQRLFLVTAPVLQVKGS